MTKPSESGHFSLGCPILQKLPESWLRGARLRVFLMFVIDLALFFPSEMILRCRFSIEVLAVKALIKMSVKVNLKNLTTDINQMYFHAIPLTFQVIYDHLRPSVI